MTNPPDTDPPSDLSSAACAMREADDGYMGFAEKAEVTEFLNALLEAERAGALVTLDTAREAREGPIAGLMHDIARDEQRWCAMLVRQLEALGARHSDAVGAFHGKAMAIANLEARIAFINRGQGWVVRKLREMLPRVRDDRLHADLADMLQSHESNILRADEALGAETRPNP
jgi:nitronate monooxygenase